MPAGDDTANRVRGAARECARPSGTPRACQPNSTYRALQTSPLSRLASNGNEQAHVRTSAILGYN
ncbi:hypothetical protein [Paraburkholderia lycopersici]|uniref:Uncharacterized protein n=1 Tax=Paraburkholderia lycopersici TaxID=416944 RepID=A0A1G6X4J1_9BURK|nr:hypothetical protein [Paraburkholderia lycopersici]SDD72235.1 hypothetical protein SAMN05421548_12451 [Paraburkholderia lycopersici]